MQYCSFKTHLWRNYVTKYLQRSISKKTDFKLWKNHVVPLLPKDSCPYYTIEYCRHTACHVLLPCTPSDFQLCDICFSESSRNVISNKATPAKAKAPLSCLTKEKLVATLKDTRVYLKEVKLKCDQLKSRIKRMQNEIYQHGITLDSTLEDELTKIITATSLESTPHMKLVWEQQKKLSVNHQKMVIDGTPTLFGLVYHYIPRRLVSIEN